MSGAEHMESAAPGESTEQTPGAAPGVRLRWTQIAVLGFAGLFYAYAIWNAIAYLLGFIGTGLSGLGWFVLLFAVVLPILVFGLAWSIARRRNAGELALTLLAGLGLVAVFWMNVVWYSTVVGVASLAG